MSLSLRLEPIGPDQLDRVAGVRVAPEQLKFSGSVQEAFEAAEEGVDFHGMFLGPDAVGFFKIDRLYATRFPFVAAGDIGLRAFMVDITRQGMGIATRAVLALPAYLNTTYTAAKTIWLTVNKANPAAVRAYLKGGFEDTGEEWPHGDAGPQHILQLALS